ncbi:MAG TPA: hypothetical protein VMT00_05915 [Thermoanaerobaculia bacterium]|nr:hypothetical protein [Thermoanaerobaculia bacterium]
MAAHLGRALQLIGMAILPIALYTGLVKDDVRTEVKLLFAGAIVFFIGWLIARRSGDA